mgnify:FL=1
MDISIPNDLETPLTDDNFKNLTSERSDRLNELLIEQLNARDIINRESQERIDEFLQGTQSEVNFDPSYIEFFRESQERIESLNKLYQRLQDGEKPQQKEIEELNRRIESASSFFTGINEALSSNLNTIETKTNSLIRELQRLSTTYENELITNRDRKKRLEDLKKQKQNQ